MFSSTTFASPIQRRVHVDLSLTPHFSHSCAGGLVACQPTTAMEPWIPQQTGAGGVPIDFAQTEPYMQPPADAHQIFTDGREICVFPMPVSILAAPNVCCLNPFPLHPHTDAALDPHTDASLDYASHRGNGDGHPDASREFTLIVKCNRLVKCLYRR